MLSSPSPAGGQQQPVPTSEQERADFTKFKQQLEMEFNQKRAKFKELYMSKEGESVFNLSIPPAV